MRASACAIPGFMRKTAAARVKAIGLPCLLALGSDRFSTRLWRVDKITGPWPNEETLILNAEFLVPERALPRFPIGTMAQVLVDNTFIGSVTVLRDHAEGKHVYMGSNTII